MRYRFMLVILLAALLGLAGCAAEGQTAPEPPVNEGEENNMILRIGETEVPVTWEDNPSVDAVRELLPLTVEMSMYGGFEQVGPVGRNIVRNDVQTDTAPGDIVLYAGNQIVVFYGHNSWAYTRLGHIDLAPQEMEELLGRGAVTLTITGNAE